MAGMNDMLRSLEIQPEVSCCRSQYYGTRILRKAGPLARRLEARLRSVFPDPGFGVRFEGFQHWIFLGNGPFASERVPCSGSDVPVHWFWGRRSN